MESTSEFYNALLRVTDEVVFRKGSFAFVPLCEGDQGARPLSFFLAHHHRWLETCFFVAVFFSSSPFLFFLAFLPFSLLLFLSFFFSPLFFLLFCSSSSSVLHPLPVFLSSPLLRFFFLCVCVCVSVSVLGNNTCVFLLYDCSAEDSCWRLMAWSWSYEEENQHRLVAVNFT